MLAQNERDLHFSRDHNHPRLPTSLLLLVVVLVPLLASMVRRLPTAWA